MWIPGAWAGRRVTTHMCWRAFAWGAAEVDAGLAVGCVALRGRPLVTTYLGECSCNGLRFGQVSPDPDVGVDKDDFQTGPPHTPARAERCSASASATWSMNARTRLFASSSGNVSTQRSIRKTSSRGAIRSSAGSVSPRTHGRI